jgi:secreted trypsin-like serine protease
LISQSNIFGGSPIDNWNFVFFFYKGDSGSGLAIKQNDKWVLKGVVSATMSTSCDGEAHVVFTHVGHFVNWIQGFISQTYV